MNEWILIVSQLGCDSRSHSAQASWFRLWLFPGDVTPGDPDSILTHIQTMILALILAHISYGFSSYPDSDSDFFTSWKSDSASDPTSAFDSGVWFWLWICDSDFDSHPESNISECILIILCHILIWFWLLFCFCSFLLSVILILILTLILADSDSESAWLWFWLLSLTCSISDYDCDTDSEYHSVQLRFWTSSHLINWFWLKPLLGL